MLEYLLKCAPAGTASHISSDNPVTSDDMTMPQLLEMHGPVLMNLLVTLECTYSGKKVILPILVTIVAFRMI